MQIEKRRLKKPSLFDFLHESAGGRAAPMALHGAKGEILSRENGPLFRTGAKGERRARRGTKGGILFSKRIPPLNPPEKGKGRPLRPPTLPVWCLKSCTRCAIGRGVHGFAMNPYYSLPLATAPYYREARVTVVGRQTACGGGTAALAVSIKKTSCRVLDRAECFDIMNI